MIQLSSDWSILQMDVSGHTPLHLAARMGNTTTASTLLNLGASVNMKVSSDLASH